MPSKVFGVLLVSAAMAAPVRPAPAQAPAQEPTKLTPDQKREINKITGQFRLARRDPEKRKEAVEKAIEYGPLAVSAMSSVVGREMYPQMQRYGGLFYKQAAAVAQQQVSKADPQEVASLQQKVLGLQKRADFSEKLIVREGDPAMKRLKEIFVVNRAKILDESESLRGERERLGQLGALWEKCAVYLWEQIPSGENKPKERPSFEEYLQGEESLAAGLAAPMGAKTREILAANTRLAARIDPEEARAILACNLTRNLLGLGALVIDLRLCDAARDHSGDMQKLKFFAHDSPVPGKKEPWDRAKRFGTTASAENIAMGYSDGQAVNLCWFHSPGHHKNMLDSHARIGIGRAGSYYTELFGQ